MTAYFDILSYQYDTTLFKSASYVLEFVTLYM